MVAVPPGHAAVHGESPFALTRGEPRRVRFRHGAGQRAGTRCIRPSGGRTWWAHLKSTRINIELTILRKKIEDRREADATFVNGLTISGRSATLSYQ